jgi:hypothetical protein
MTRTQTFLVLQKQEANQIAVGLQFLSVSHVLRLNSSFTLGMISLARSDYSSLNTPCIGNSLYRSFPAPLASA